MDCRFFNVTSPDWQYTLSGLDHDVYHLPGYVTLAATEENGEALGFVASDAEGSFFVPLIVRQLPPHLCQDGAFLDATGPRGYPGPLYRGGAASDFLDRALGGFVAALRERGLVSAFIRLHPLFPLPEAALRRVGDVVHHGETVAIDLTRDLDDLWRQTRQNHRRDITRAERQGHVVRMDPDWAAFDTFVDLYAQTMRRLEASPAYFYSRAYFAGLRQALGDRVHLCVVEVEGQVVSAGLFSEVGGIVEYLYSGTTAAGLRHSALKSMLHVVRGWAKARGNHTFHLGGSLGPGDPLIHFKLGFSPRTHPVLSWRIVADPDAYEELSLQATGRVDPDPAVSETFFPRYRSAG